MTFIDAIRTLRKERDLTYKEARDQAIAYWKKNNLPLPEAFKRLAEKCSK